MKELSIEEKAKRYDEAIEKARIWKDKSGMPKDKQGILDDIFPELAELEDERTRESLLEFLHTLPNHYTRSGVCVLEWIAWLEKQGEKPAAWSEEDKRKIDRIYSILRQASDTHAFSTSCRLIGDKECIELQDFLKSLRPKSQWKPSDEQMNALSAINVTGSVSYAGQGQELINLYQDLKKLKG